MVEIIYGHKGSGKTKQIIDKANNSVVNAKGDIVLITDTDRYNYDLVHQIRIVNTSKLGINSIEMLKGVVVGLLAGNYDISNIYIDGVARITGVDITEMESLFKLFDKYENVSITVTISSDILPEFIAKYTK